VPTAAALPLPASSAGRCGTLPIGGGAFRLRSIRWWRQLAGVAAPGDKVARTPPLGGGVVRLLVAAPSRHRYGPFGPHLGGEPSLGMVVPPPAAGGVARAGGGLDGGVPTAVWRRELHEPAGSARQGGPGLLLLMRPVGYRHWRGRSCPLVCLLFSHSSLPVASFHSR
jgi:hypothetical protein